MNEWLKNHLVCPRDKQPLELKNETLVSSSGHIYPIYDGIPIMLINDTEITHHYIDRTFEKVAEKNTTVIEDLNNQNNSEKDFEVDDFVQKEIPLTSGNLYFSVQNKLTRYPIPEIRLPKGNGETLLDIGCNWGRWSIAAAQKGYKPVGIDPNLDAVLAARRASKHLGVETNFVVGDARFLPFADESFEVVFSYGVYQHFSKENTRISLDEAKRVLQKNGKTLFQMANKYGIRSFQQRWRRGFTEGEDFDVRHWTPAELMETFEKRFGKMKLTSDCYFGLGIQGSDVDLLPIHYKAVVYSSGILRRISQVITPLRKLADSVYLESINLHK